MDKNQYQLGNTKIFIKAPESLFMLEEQRERKYNYYARIIQKAFKKYYAKRQLEQQMEDALSIVFGKKERRRYSINRIFVGDYIGMDLHPSLQNLVGRREKIFYAEVVKKYDRRFKSTLRDLIVTSRAVFLIGREQIKKGIHKGKFVEVIKRKMNFENINYISVSCLQDDFVIIHMKEDYDSLLELAFKTEFLSVLNKKYKTHLGKEIVIKFSNSCEFKIKKEGWGGGGTRQVKFIKSSNLGDLAILRPSGKSLLVSIGPGFPNSSKPSKRKQPYSRKKSGFVSKDPKPLINDSAPSRTAPQIPAAGHTRIRPPPPPSEPAPPNQPTVKPGHRFHSSNVLPGKIKVMPNIAQAVQKQQQKSSTSQNFMQTPKSGVSGQKRASLESVKPIPGRGMPKPEMKPRPQFPKCKALYDYSAQDLDEISFKDGDIIEILQEHEGGWWRGRINGKEGLMPSNYIEKL